jgi:hypothetical protein
LYHFIHFRLNIKYIKRKEKEELRMLRASYTYPDGSEYKGEWNTEGQRHGFGVLILNDGTGYAGEFANGLCHGLGVLTFSDSSKYEGEFYQGKYNNLGVFTRCDQMKYEGEFKDGKLIGRGLVTYTDGTHGLPRNEGYFEGNKLIRREKCTDLIMKANQTAKNANKLVQSKS